MPRMMAKKNSKRRGQFHGSIRRRISGRFGAHLGARRGHLWRDTVDRPIWSRHLQSLFHRPKVWRRKLKPCACWNARAEFLPPGRQEKIANRRPVTLQERMVAIRQLLKGKRLIK